VLDEIARLAREVPPREAEHRRRAAALTPSSLDDTHPPTGLRIRMLELWPAPATYALTAADHARILAELEYARGPIAARVVEDYRDDLYA
jgi:hypothetical protein